MYGPHGAPDFFTTEDIQTFFSTAWKVHHNSDRTGTRLIGPKPQWARSDGGEAGLHPSNIHDNAYAVGTIDFTGDMPIILGPDGPSLGGFVCPMTITTDERWKIGQLAPGDVHTLTERIVGLQPEARELFFFTCAAENKHRKLRLSRLADLVTSGRLCARTGHFAKWMFRTFPLVD